MPMDTPRVPSDEFELAFLKKVNCNSNYFFINLAYITPLLSQDSSSNCSIDKI